MKIDIEDIIKEDLSAYSQGHEPELYVPIFIPGNPWRCYVFGDCFSLVAYDSRNWVYIRYIADDDGYYWLDDDGMFLAAGWIDSIQKVSTIMRDWLDANCKRGYYSGHEGEDGWECSYKGLK